MQTSVLKNYPAGVAHEVHPEQYRSLAQLFDESFKPYGDRSFSVCMERWMSYRELDTLSKALGAWLQSRGLESGARVAIKLPNVPQFAVTICGVLRAGYTCVNVNPLYTAPDLEHQVSNKAFTGTIGLPLPGIEIAIKDDEGRSVPTGESGELCIKGPNVMTGYYNQPAETAAAFHARRLHAYRRHRRDAAGRLRPHRRPQEGHDPGQRLQRVPQRTRKCHLAVPGVLECAAIGVPDEKQGEAIKVFVVRKEPALSEEAAMRYCSDQQTGYKRPKHIEFRDALPKTNVGKILRRELRVGAQ